MFKVKPEIKCYIGNKTGIRYSDISGNTICVDRLNINNSINESNSNNSVNRTQGVIN